MTFLKPSITVPSAFPSLTAHSLVAEGGHLTWARFSTGGGARRRLAHFGTHRRRLGNYAGVPCPVNSATFFTTGCPFHSKAISSLLTLRSLNWPMVSPI